MVHVKRINTIDELKDLVFEQVRNQENGRFRSSYFYRGMPDATFDLSTSLMRNCINKQPAIAVQTDRLWLISEYVSESPA